jgi:hypothetical protein
MTMTAVRAPVPIAPDSHGVAVLAG